MKAPFTKPNFNKLLALFVFSSAIISCGTYRNVSNDDGIYADETSANQKKKVVVVNQQEYAKYNNDYFAEELELADEINKEDIFLNADEYNSVDTVYVEGDDTLDYNPNQPWGRGQDNDVVVNINVNPYPFWNNSWGFQNNWGGRNNWLFYGAGFHDPFWNAGYAWNGYNPYFRGYNAYRYNPYRSNRYNNYRYGRRNTAYNRFNRRNSVYARNNAYSTTRNNRRTVRSSRNTTRTSTNNNPRRRTTTEEREASIRKNRTVRGKRAVKPVRNTRKAPTRANRRTKSKRTRGEAPTRTRRNRNSAPTRTRSSSNRSNNSRSSSRPSTRSRGSSSSRGSSRSNRSSGKSSGGSSRRNN